MRTERSFRHCRRMNWPRGIPRRANRKPRHYVSQRSERNKEGSSTSLGPLPILTIGRKLRIWTLDEALALSFGKAPERVNWERVKPHVGVSPFAFQDGRRRDLALRAVQWQQLYDPVLPGIFLAWAKRNEFVLPENLEAGVAARGVKVGDWQSLYEELAASLENQGQQWLALSRSKDELISALERRLSEQCPATPPEKALSTRERDSLLKLVIGMAVGGYGHDPKAKRSEQCAAIADDLAKTGVPLDVDTVRKWLREASGLLPGDYMP
jgi:hypothetical protein